MTNDPPPIANMLLAGLAALLMLALLFFAVKVSAHDRNRPELNNWFMSLQSKSRSPCCDGSEATRLDDPDWENNNGHYRVRLDGEWVDVPDSAIVEGPNRDGRAMVWPYYLNGGMRGVRCFMPGAMT